MKRLLLLFTALTSLFSAAATPITVRILTTKVITSFIVSPISGAYRIYGDGMLLTEADASGIFQMTLDKDSIVLKSFERTIGKYAGLKMIAQQPDGAFKIKSVIPESRVRTYEDDIYIGLAGDKKQL